MKAFLLAAGKGRRLLPLTETTPKPLIEVAGEPLIVRQIEQLKLSGISEFVINTHWLADRLQNYLGDGSKFDVEIIWSHEEELLETGGGIQKALPAIGNEPFVLVSADIWTDFNYSEFLVQPLPSNEVARLVLVDNPDHHSGGDFLLETESKESKFGLVRIPLGQGMDTFTYSGIAVIRPDWVRSWKIGQSAFPLREPLFQAIEKDQISGYHFKGVWTDVGSLDRLQAIRNKLEVEYVGN